MKGPIHPRQVRAARALLAMSQEELAGEADLGLATVKRFESGRTTRIVVERSLRSALEKRGVIIIDPTSLPAGAPPGIGVIVSVAAFEASSRREEDEAISPQRRRTRSV